MADWFPPAFAWRLRSTAATCFVAPCTCPEGGKASVDLTKVKGSLGVKWIHLSTGGSAVVDPVTGGEDREFSAPFGGDAVLYLKWLVAECDRRGLVVDVTLARSVQRIAAIEAHRRAVEVIVSALKPHRNWYLDLANGRDVRDARFVAPAELKKLRELVRQLDPSRLVTASFGGHDLSEQGERKR